MKQLKHIERIIFDADDTLWENNIHYVQAANDFFDLLTDRGIRRDDVEQAFDALELQVVRERGYGSHNFVYILETLYERFNRELDHKIDAEKFEIIIERFKDHPLRKPALFSGVPETLQQLSRRFQLYILTKGAYQEQKGKILRSGLQYYVQDFFIVAEKSDEIYQNILKQNNWRADESCMVGNSPKSDINPALRCGMFAVHIPYKDTWKLDDEPVLSQNGRLITIDDFRQLNELFLPASSS